jgi:hypothetical protein
MSKNIWQVDLSKSFEHTGRHGTVLKAPSMDIAKGVVKVYKPRGLSDSKFAEDMTNIIGWWSANVYNDLNGFQGFDCVCIEVIEVDH